jgi:hypothetical protein
MILGRVAVDTFEDFSVVDVTNMLVPSLSATDFTFQLFAPDKTEVGSTTVPVTIEELGGGHYRASFTPDVTGLWLLVIYHSEYFPWGKSGNVQVFANDFDSMTTIISRVLGLVQENYFLDSCTYNESGCLLTGRMRTYKDGISVGTDINVLATYLITSTYNSGGNLNSYKVIQI